MKRLVLFLLALVLSTLPVQHVQAALMASWKPSVQAIRSSGASAPVFGTQVPLMITPERVNLSGGGVMTAHAAIPRDYDGEAAEDITGQTIVLKFDQSEAWGLKAGHNMLVVEFTLSNGDTTLWFYGYDVIFAFYPPSD